MSMRHIRTVDQIVNLEIGFGGDMSPAGLTEAIIEALEPNIIDAAGIVYIKASANGERLHAIDLWAPDPVEEVEPPSTPVDDEELKGPIPN